MNGCVLLQTTLVAKAGEKRRTYVDAIIFYIHPRLTLAMIGCAVAPRYNYSIASYNPSEVCLSGSNSRLTNSIEQPL